MTPRTALTILAVLGATAALALPAADALAAGSTSTGGAGVLAPPARHPHARSAARPAASGLATWYGPGFYGHKTACGQRLTQALVGVANRALPCGTLVRVSYAGQTLVVPVLDRGPYGGIGAEWDLTAGAASALGISETVRIGARVVGSVANGPTLGLPAGALAAAPAGGAGALAGGTVAAAS